MKLAVISLGCPKNQVDADVFCRALLEEGWQTVDDVREADVAIVNTCGFIQSAKEESIGAILDVCAQKADHPLKVVVTGCLAERYRSQLAQQIPEVDAVVGIGANGRLPAILREVAARPAQPAAPPCECYGPKAALALGGPRVIGTPRQYAYLKISEGCSNRCHYCAIPAIRGPLRSRPQQDILAEAAWLTAQGVRELVVVAQDITAYGDDTGHNGAAQLLRALDAVPGVEWIRLLYAYPERITDEFIAAMAECRHILPYLDMPIQHCSQHVLQAMNRHGGAPAVHSAIRRLRAAIPHITLRTTLLVGYPGETKEDLEELCRFVETTRFERLGCFAFSPEEGTVACRLPGRVPAAVRRRRADTIMRLQAEVTAAAQAARVGATERMLCDGWDEQAGCYVCRGAADAPEIDTVCYVHSARPLTAGAFYPVQITGADVYDLTGEVAGEL